MSLIRKLGERCVAYKTNQRSASYAVAFLDLNAVVVKVGVNADDSALVADFPGRMLLCCGSP